jgi:glutamate synthase domain-containing protein 3
MPSVDLEQASVRELNQRLHELGPGSNETEWTITNPLGRHAIAAGLDAAVNLAIDGHVGYYCGGMNKQAALVINGNAGQGLAENIMSGTVRCTGNASQSAGASGHGGLVVVAGDASSRCGISMKGVDIVVGGSVGHFSAFMAQAGHLVVCGDAGDNLGDSIYEAVIYVGGEVGSLGADCIEEAMTAADRDTLTGLLERAAIDRDAARFRRYGSARQLYHFHIDNAGSY